MTPWTQLEFIGMFQSHWCRVPVFCRDQLAKERPRSNPEPNIDQWISWLPLRPRGKTIICAQVGSEIRGSAHGHTISILIVIQGPLTPAEQSFRSPSAAFLAPFPRRSTSRTLVRRDYYYSQISGLQTKASAAVPLLSVSFASF